MLEQLYVKSQPNPMTVIPTTSRLLVTGSNEKNGVISRSTEFRDVSVADNFKECNIMDFEIGNILATGAVQLLKPVNFQNSDVDSIVQQVDNIANGIDNAVSQTE